MVARRAHNPKAAGSSPAPATANPRAIGGSSFSDSMAHKAGYVNIIGEPNTGKSTLLNALLGEDLVIVNPKAQTTRHRILGLLNGEDHQIVLSDTPGVLDPQYRMQERMMDAVDEALIDADILIVMVELGQRPERSEHLLKRAHRFKGPMVVLVGVDAMWARTGAWMRPWASPREKVAMAVSTKGSQWDIAIGDQVPMRSPSQAPTSSAWPMNARAPTLPTSGSRSARCSSASICSPRS